MTAMTDELVTTGEAAKAVGVNSTTLQRWAAAGSVTPALTTAGGHLRWNLDTLRQEVAKFSERGKS